MAGQKQDDQLEHTFSSYVRIRDVVYCGCYGGCYCEFIVDVIAPLLLPFCVKEGYARKRDVVTVDVIVDVIVSLLWMLLLHCCCHFV